MPFGRDYEYAKPSMMPTWMDEFADKELAREAAGESPFHELRSLLQRNKELSAVESKVRELTQRIGLDLVRSAEDASLEKTAAAPCLAELAALAQHLRIMADDYDARGMRQEADAVDMLLAMAEKAAERASEESSEGSSKEPASPFPEGSKVKRIIDNIIQSRRGQVSPWAIVQQLRSEFARDVEREEVSPEDEAVKQYIKDRIKELREDVEAMSTDDTAGLGVGLQTTQEDADLEDRMFEPASRFQR
jgi:hypothetical protein